MNPETKNRPTPRCIVRRRWAGLLAPFAVAATLLVWASAAQAAPTFQAAGTRQGGQGNVTVAWPTHQVDDIALLVVESTGGETIQLSVANGFVQVTNSPKSTGTGTSGTRLAVFWARATSTSMPSPIVQDPGNHVSAQILTYRNVIATGNPWDVTGGGVKASASNTVSVTGVTTTVADTLIVQAVSRDNDSSAAAFSGQANANLTSLTERSDGGTTSGNGGGFAVWDGVMATAGGTGNTTANIVTNVVNAFLTIALKPTTGPVIPPGGFPLTQCAGDRFGSDLGCTANDVQITSLEAVGAPSSCKAGDYITLDLKVTVNSGSPDRYDIGIFLSNDGKDPQLMQANGGPASCKVAILPTDDPPFRNTDPGPHAGTADTCGDVNGTMNAAGIGGVPQGSGVLYVYSTTVKCQAKSGSSGQLFVPFVVSWDQQASPSGGLCTSANYPVPGTVSKCNAPTVDQGTVVGLIVLPKIEKSDGVTVIAPGQSTNYSVVITNNTGDTVASATFKDPAVTYLTANSVTCSASGGATCPASPTVAAMQGAGIAISSMPAGSSLTFTVNATVSAGAPIGALITNIAQVITQGETNEASDTNTVGYTSLDHYELSLPTQSIACAPTTVTVTACADSTSPCTNVYSAASGTATLATSGGTLGSTGPAFTSGVASTTLSYTSATNGQVATITLSGVTAPNPNKCCPDGTNCAVGNSCSTTYIRDGLYFTDTNGGNPASITSQTAGVRSGTFYLRAVSTRWNGTCNDALNGTKTVDLAYECNDPATCYASNMMQIDTGPVTTIARNNDGSIASYTAVNMTFDGNGYAPFSVIYNDVGQVTLHAKYSTTLTGASNPFIVKPYNFLLSGITCSAPACATANVTGANPAAADETGAAFVKAGSPFSVTVTSVNASGAATPSYGREATPQGVKLTPTLVSPSGGVNPAIGNLTAFGTFTNGVATGTTFSWREVGIITLRPSVDDGNYLSAGDVIGSSSGNVGRFIPHHFKVTATPGCSGGATYTYSGQPFAATATARALGGTTTENYRGSAPVYAKATTFTDVDASDTATCTNNTLAASGYASGIGTQSGVVCTFPAKETAPGITLRAAEAAGGDSVTSADGNASSDGDASVDLRSGRVRLFNANGSELLDLAVPMRVEYYHSANDGWITNTGDTCSSVPLGTLTNFRRNLNSGETCVQDTGNPGVSGQGCAVAGPVAELYATTPVTGGYNLYLRAPGAGNDGSVDLSANLSSKTWLRYDWTGSGESDPTAKATFGTWRGNPRHIHLRELY